jgi:hypothetical protein
MKPKKSGSEQATEVNRVGKHYIWYCRMETAPENVFQYIFESLSLDTLSE